MNLCEFIGFLYGDGNIYYSKKYRKYRIELVGGEEDYEYIRQINDFLFETTNKKPLFFIRKERIGKTIRLHFNNKEFVDKLISMGLVSGRKTFTAIVPEFIFKNKENFCDFLRGLFEADGCLYFSKSKKGEFPTYPRLEIVSSSENLVEQIKSFLERENFIVYVKKKKGTRSFGIYLSGEKMLEKWKDLIGLNSQKNRTKYDLWKAKGFYIPHTPLKERINICTGGTMVNAPPCSL